MDRSLFHSPKTLLDRLRNRSPPTVDDPAHAHHLVYACGYNATGQLGCGDRESRVVPWRVRTSRLGKGRVDGVACGSSYSVVVVAGQVASCGKNVHGQLGHGGRDEETAPRVVEGLRGVRVVAVAARGAHTLALDDRGRVYSWGRGDEGQLGHGAFEAVPHPRRIARLPTSVVAVGAGRTHSLALDADGAVYSWGCGDDGALGHGDRRRQLAPRAVEFFKTRPAAAVSCGSRHNAVVTADGALVTWGWAAYGQCGASAGGDGLRPAEVPLPGDGGAECVLAACGYRHTLCATRHASGDAIWAFGWNAYGQCGGSTCSAAAPRRVGGKFLGSQEGGDGAVVEALSAGGRHSVCCVRLPGGGTATYAWGRGDDGQLGSGDRRDRRATPRVAATAARVNSVGQRPLRGLACGWAHTVFVVDAPPSSLLETPPRALLPRTPPAPGLRAPRAAAFARVAFSRGDVDGVCGQLLGTVLSLVVIQKRTVAVSGLSPAFVSGTLLPGCAVATAVGNVCFALMALAVGPNATAQPQGVSAVLLAVILSQVVAPEKASRGDAVSSYEAALFVASLVGILELLMAPFVAQLKASVPSAALHASVAGQALVGLTMGFAGDVFAAPADALGPLVVCFCCYGAQVRLPYNAPGGAGALALGALLAAPLGAAFGGDAGGGRAAGPVPWATLAVVSPPSLGGLPHLARAYASRESLKYVPVAIPLALTNVFNTLAQVEAARNVGDAYSPTLSVCCDALATVLGAACGCPFPTQVFVGQPAFKQMGARHGYMLGSGFVALVVGCSPRLMVWVTAAFPLAAGAGFLFWIGLAVTASAFSPASSGLHSSHFASAAATAMGLVPVIAAWGTQLVSSTTAAAGADARRVFGDLQRAGVDASGLAALAQGSLLSSVSLAATLASVLDRHFGAAALWSLLNAALAGLGFIHAYRIDHAAVVADVGGLVFLRNSKALQAAVGYLLAAAILLWFSVREDIELRPDALRRRLLRVRDFCLPRRRRHRGAGDERSPLVAQLPKPSAQFLPIHAAPERETARPQSRDAAASL